MRYDSAHQYTQAVTVLPDDLDNPDVGGFTGAIYDQPTYTGPEVLPPGVSELRGYRGAWWTFVPADNPSDHPRRVYGYGWGVAVYLDVWRVDAAGWTPVGQTGPAQEYTFTADVTDMAVGQTYYARIGTVTDTDAFAVYLLGDGMFVQDPSTAAGTGGGTAGGGGTDTGGGTGGTVTPPAAVVLALVAGPAGAGVDTPAPLTNDATAVPLAPVGVSVPGSRPAFTVAATASGPGQQVQVQWTGDPTFTTVAGTVAGDVPVGRDDAQIAVQPDTDLPDGVIYWRARIVGAAGPGPFSGTARFALNSLEGQGVAAGDFTVTADTTAAPHLWYIDHDESGTDAGGRIVIVGAGFGTNPTVRLGATVCPLLEALDVPADPADSTAPLISPGVACTPAHQQLTASIPAVDADAVGDAVTVHRQD